MPSIRYSQQLCSQLRGPAGALLLPCSPLAVPACLAGRACKSMAARKAAAATSRCAAPGFQTLWQRGWPSCPRGDKECALPSCTRPARSSPSMSCHFSRPPFSPGCAPVCGLPAGGAVEVEVPRRIPSNVEELKQHNNSIQRRAGGLLWCSRPAPPLAPPVSRCLGGAADWSSFFLLC